MQPNKMWLISDTIERNKRVFKIPVYQRNYEWSNVQCEKLFSDVIEAFASQKKHFTGTIVYITGEHHSSKLSEELIIDGQQRITTIMIFLKALLDIAIEKNDSIVAELQDLLFNRRCEEECKLKLKPVKADNKQFYALMQNNKDQYDKNSNIIRNYNLFVKLINIYMERGFSLNDILEGLKKLEIVEIVLDKSQGDDPQVIFESINSTGLELSLADKIRNYVLMDDVQQDMLFERYWLPLEELIGIKCLANYFITYLDYKMTETISKENAYDRFIKLCKDNSLTHEQVLKDLTRYAKYYAAFIGRGNTYSYKINSYLQDFRDLDQSTLFLFLFDVFSDYENEKIRESDVLQVLSFFRSYCVRRIVCERPSNSLRGLFKTLYNKLFKDGGCDKYYETIYTYFKTTNTRDKLVEDEEFYDSLIHKKLYQKKKVCKFLLSAIENENSNETLNVENLTIEHVLPQKENALVWKRALGNEYLDTYSNYLHTLGNLTITGYNRELGTKSFAEKKKMISELSKARVLNELILSAPEWNEKAILNRADKLAKKVLDIFRIEKTELQQKTVLQTSASTTYTLNDQDGVSGTTPTSYTFYGETVAVKTYSAMLTSIINTLYDLDPTIIEELAKSKFQATSSDRIYISTEESDLRRYKEIENTGFFYECNLSANSILQFIKVLIEKHELDSDEFEFVCE